MLHKWLSELVNKLGMASIVVSPAIWGFMRGG